MDEITAAFMATNQRTVFAWGRQYQPIRTQHFDVIAADLAMDPIRMDRLAGFRCRSNVDLYDVIGPETNRSL